MMLPMCMRFFSMFWTWIRFTVVYYNGFMGQCADKSHPGSLQSLSGSTRTNNKNSVFYDYSPGVIKHFHSVHVLWCDFSLAVQWETVTEVSVYTVYIYHNAAGTSKCQHCLCN